MSPTSPQASPHSNSFPPDWPPSLPLSIASPFPPLPLQISRLITVLLIIRVCKITKSAFYIPYSNLHHPSEKTADNAEELTPLFSINSSKLLALWPFSPPNVQTGCVVLVSALAHLESFSDIGVDTCFDIQSHRDLRQWCQSRQQLHIDQGNGGAIDMESDGFDEL